MNKKNIIIAGLIVLAVVMFGIIQFKIIPANHNKQIMYAQNQTDALSHDISVVEGFKSPYIGDASNAINLFYALPLSNISMKFQIDPETCTLTVNYLDTVWNIGEEKVYRDLVYNSIAAMAAIDNLNAVRYEFPGESFVFERKQIEYIFGSPLSNLLDKEVWKEQVQTQLTADDFVEQFYMK